VTARELIARGKRAARNAAGDELTPGELRFLRSLKTPHGIQHYLDSLPYHLAGTAWSPRLVMRHGTAHCLEGAVFAAAALRALGHPPLIFDMEAPHDTDHVMAIYQVRGHWGAIAKSNWSGCRGRDPVYRSLRELAMSYFNLYCNRRRERTLRTFSAPVDLGRFDRRRWTTHPKDVWFIAEYLCDIPHTRLLKPGMERFLSRVDERLFAAELTGHKWKKAPGG
jgi:hypothetical protein